MGQNAAKDSVKKHINSIQQQEAETFKTKSNLGAEGYRNNVVQNTWIGKSLLKFNSEDTEGVRLKITIIHHIVKVKIHSPTIQSF